MRSTNSEVSNAVKTQEFKMVRGAVTQDSDDPNFNEYILNTDTLSRGSEAVNSGAEVLQSVFSRSGKSQSDEEMQRVLDSMGQTQGEDEFDDAHSGEVSKTSFKRLNQKHFLRSDVSDRDREEALDKMDNLLSELIPEADRKAIGDLTSAVLSGDIEKLAKTVQELGDDPAKLDAYIKELNKDLEKNGSDTRMAVNKDGKVVVYGSGDRGVEVDPKTGKTSIFKVERDLTGDVTQGGEVLNADARKTWKDISGDTTRDINGENKIRIIGGGMDKPGIDPFDSKPFYFEPHEPGPFEPIMKRPHIFELDGRDLWMKSKF